MIKLILFLQGLIQSVFELHDGSGVVVTVGKYVTPNHMDINGNGVEPDFRSLPCKNSPCPDINNFSSSKSNFNLLFTAWDEVMNNLFKCHKPQEG